MSLVPDEDGDADFRCLVPTVLIYEVKRPWLFCSNRARDVVDIDRLRMTLWRSNVIMFILIQCVYVDLIKSDYMKLLESESVSSEMQKGVTCGSVLPLDIFSHLHSEKVRNTLVPKWKWERVIKVDIGQHLDNKEERVNRRRSRICIMSSSPPGSARRFPLLQMPAQVPATWDIEMVTGD